MKELEWATYSHPRNLFPPPGGFVRSEKQTDYLFPGQVGTLIVRRFCAVFPLFSQGQIQRC